MRGIVVTAFLLCVFPALVWADVFDDFAKAQKADEDGNYELAIDWYTKVIRSGELNAGNLAITYSKKNRKYFVACNAYPECKTTFSLPPNGLIKISGKSCEDCEFPMLIRISRGRRPWEFCFNPKCVKNKERIEKYKKKKEEEK